MVTECFILNNTDMATIFAGNGADIKGNLPAYTLFYVVPGYDVFPEERVSSHIKNITEITKRLGVEAKKAIGGISANEIMKAAQQPCPDPYWKLRAKGASEDVLFLTINDNVQNTIDTMKKMAEKAGYPVSDIGIYIQPVVQGTSVHCEFNLPYDRNNSNESARVKKLALEATKGLMAQGAFFSRPYGEAAGMIMNRDAASKTVLTRLKKLFDPNGVMNPGKIGF